MPNFLTPLIDFLRSPTLYYWSFLFSLLLILLINITLLLTRPLASRPITPPNINWKNRFSFYFISLLRGLRRHVVFANITLIMVALLSLGALMVPSPRVSWPVSPAFGTTTVDIEHPLTITFDRPINIHQLEVSTTPSLSGHWFTDTDRYAPFFRNHLHFYPTESLPREAEYSISIKNISSPVKLKSPSNYFFTFHTPSFPKIAATSPANESENIDINQSIKIILDQADPYGSDWQFTLSPELAHQITKDKKGNIYTLKPTGSWQKGTKYTLNIYRIPLTYNFAKRKVTKRGEKNKASTLTFTTIASPSVKNVSPTGTGILTDTSVKIEFRQDMDKSSVEKAWTISPVAEGKFSWQDNRNLTFTPTAWQKNTRYRVSIAKSATSAYGTPFDNDYSFEFTTIGPVAVSSFSPANGANNISLNQAIKVVFNQAVDHPSAESKFSISPSVSGTFDWSGNTLTFNHGDFAYSQTYTVKIASGVKTINGLDSTTDSTASFTTKQQSVTLNIPSYKQGYKYSCFSAAARDALAYRGVNVSETTLLNEIGYDSTPWSGTWQDPNATWGNPNSGIVGDINGNAAPGWGYGAHWGPVASAMSKYRSVEVKTGWSVQGIAQEIAAGNPVIVWWINGVWPAYEVYWKNNGQSIRAVNSMHVQTIKGFTGSVDNPTSFTVNDSGYGYPGRTFDVGTFKAKWGWFGNAAIIVR